MPVVDQDIEVNAPIDAVYDCWTQYERFPQWMEHVKEVRQVAPGRTHWVAEAAGQRIEWDATTLAETNRRVAWQAVGESGQSGEVRFEQAGPSKTRISVHMDYKLDSAAKEAAASTLGIDDRAVKSDLKSFKDMIEGGRF